MKNTNVKLVGMVFAVTLVSQIMFSLLNRTFNFFTGDFFLNFLISFVVILVILFILRKIIKWED